MRLRAWIRSRGCCLTAMERSIPDSKGVQPSTVRRRMARETDETGLAPHERFDAAASSYSQARPPYPPEVAPWLAQTVGLAPGDRVLDLAAGTGSLTAPLAGAGLEVTAVEPSA